MRKCSCGKDTRIEKIDGVFFSVCEKGHTYELRLGDALAEEGETVEVANDMLKTTHDSLLSFKGIPECFGGMEHFYEPRKVFEYDRLPTADSVQEAVTLFLVQRRAEEEAKVRQAAKCVKCSVFDRCRVLSPDMQHVVVHEG